MNRSSKTLVQEIQMDINDGVDGNIVDTVQKFFLPMKKEIQIQAEEKKVPKNILDFYSIYDGVELSWYSDPIKGIGGRIHFLKMEEILRDQKEILYFERDLAINSEIQYFRPFDLSTDEAQSGFLITPDFVSESIYYNTTGNPELYDLDLDFEGYIEMSKEAMGFFYWQIVLLDLQNERTSVETERFKKYMPKVFSYDIPDEDYFNFNWDNFVKKYESLRLSNRNEE